MKNHPGNQNGEKPRDVRYDVDGTEVELPVSVTLGEAGTTTLAENVEALPKERYRVEKYQVADPADVDGALDATLLHHVSPIEWDNVILYGQYVLDRARVR